MVLEKSSATPSTSTTTSTSSSTSTSRPSIIIPVTRNARPHHMAPPSPPPQSSPIPPTTTTAFSASMAPTIGDVSLTSEPAYASVTKVTTLLVDATTTLADSLMMVFSGTSETSTSGKYYKFMILVIILILELF